LLRFLALFVAKFCSVTAMVDNLLEMFGRRDVVGFGDCYNELLRISIPRLSDKSLDGPQRFVLVALKVAKMVLVGEF
jgi:hypothetical protein